MGSKIKIIKNINGDSRVADHVPTINEFDHSNYLHVEDVKRLIDRFCEKLKQIAQHHDWTKIREPYRSMFYRDLCATINGYLPDFMEGKWSKQHYYENERHHLEKCVPEDVDLFDVIEMICDCVAAGMARSEGKIYPINIPTDVLEKAVRNTVSILVEECEIVEDDGKV